MKIIIYSKNCEFRILKELYRNTFKLFKSIPLYITQSRRCPAVERSLIKRRTVREKTIVPRCARIALFNKARDGLATDTRRYSRETIKTTKLRFRPESLVFFSTFHDKRSKTRPAGEPGWEANLISSGALCIVRTSLSGTIMPFRSGAKRWNENR